MKHRLLILVLFLMPYYILAQIKLADNEVYCSQYLEILNYIQSDSLAKRLFNVSEYKFKIDNKIIGGIGDLDLLYYSIADYLKIPENPLNTNDSLINQFIQLSMIEDGLLRNYSINSHCLEDLQKDKKEFNIKVSFCRKNERIVSAFAVNKFWYIAYIFFFEKKQLKTAYEHYIILQID